MLPPLVAVRAVTVPLDPKREPAPATAPTLTQNRPADEARSQLQITRVAARHAAEPRGGFIYRVRWTRPHWKRDYPSSRLFLSLRGAENYVERLRAQGELGELYLDRLFAPSGAWQRV
jgi:hypothetical protein